MARSYATVGQMLTYAVDRSALSPDLEHPAERHVRVEVILRHMLEFVLMSPRSRDAFLRTIARTEHTTQWRPQVCSGHRAGLHREHRPVQCQLCAHLSGMRHFTVISINRVKG